MSQSTAAAFHMVCMFVDKYLNVKNFNNIEHYGPDLSIFHIKRAKLRAAQGYNVCEL